MQTFYQGKLRKDYPTAILVFSPRQIVSMLSQAMTLFPGDLIACGTGGGVGSIKPGHTVEICITGLDSLSNTMAAE